MISGVDIEDLRGVARGALDGLAPLTLLTGPHGCGKRTVLDALHIGTYYDPGSAVAASVRRRDGAPRLLRRGAARTTVTVTAPGLAAPQTTVVTDVTSTLRERLARVLQFEPSRAFRATRSDGTDYLVRFGDDLSYAVTGKASDDRVIPGFTARIAADHTIPSSVFNKATVFGHHMDVVAFLAEFVPGYRALVLLPDARGVPACHLTFTDARTPHPLERAGDGIQALVHTALTLANMRAGELALIEEPEAHQDPQALRRLADILLAAARRQVQIVLTTYSRALLDALLAAATADDLPGVARLELELHAGVLRSRRHAGPDITTVDR